MDKMHTTDILGVKVHTGLSMKSVLEVIERCFLKDGKPHYICTTNPEFIMDSAKDPAFREIINNSDLSLPDGSGVLFAMKYQDIISKIPRNFIFPAVAFLRGIWLGIRGIINPLYLGERISGVRLVEEICRICNDRGYTLFLLGGWPRDTFGRDVVSGSDMATQTAAVIKQKYPKIKIIGSSSQFKRSEKDDVLTVAMIRKCMQDSNVEHIDFLLVAYNHLHQEKWILRNSYKLPARISIGVGGTFDYLSGYKKTSPEKIGRRNLEWLFRLVTQPWRFVRISKAFPIFPLKIYLESLKS